MSNETRLALTIAVLTAAVIVVIGVVFVIAETAGLILAAAVLFGLLAFAFTQDMQS